METANLVNMIGSKENLCVSVRKAKTMHFLLNTEEVAKNLWRRADGAFTDNPRHPQ